MARKKIINPYVSFYGKYGISPVHQDISDFKLHLARREKLYRALGLPPVAFSDARLVEIGPGGGYNALAFFAWGAHVDFVEPNKKALEELPKLLSCYGVGKRQWSLSPCMIEDFKTAVPYEIVIAEGFIPGLYGRAEVISKLSRLVMPGGVISVTCIDEIGFLFELIKRMIGHRLIRVSGIKKFDDKVVLLSKAFASHLRSLKFASRPIEDWVTELFFNPALYGRFFNIAECIAEFGREFELLGTSPSIFTDYSWYKDAYFNRRDSLLDQYAARRHTLLWYKMDEGLRSGAANSMLAKKVGEFRTICKLAENNFDENNIKKATIKLKEIADLVRDLGPEISERLHEGIKLLEDKNLSTGKISESVKLASAFGRGQQYVSLVKIGCNSRGQINKMEPSYSKSGTD